MESLLSHISGNERQGMIHTQQPASLDCCRSYALLPSLSCLHPLDTMSGANKFSGSALLQKELQGLACFVAYQECHHRGESSTRTVQEASMFSQYFGNPDDEDSIGLAEQLLLGTGLFSGLYDREEVVVSSTLPTGGVNATTSSVPCHRSNITVLVLKPELHCLGVDKRITVGGASGITILSSASLKTNKEDAATFQARTMYLRAQEHLSCLGHWSSFL
jgi:hypothetical protein